MVFPAQNIIPKISGAPEDTPILDVSSTEGSPVIPEAVSSIGSPQPTGDDQNPQQITTSDTDDNIPKPGKIVDKSVHHKEEITSLSTLDPVTLKADEEENEFIPEVEKVHDAAHEQHH